MADNKKYYYLKLKDNFFDTDEMIILESMQDGYLYSNILLKLYLRSLKSEGKLMFNDRIPFNSTMLSQVTRMNVGVIEKAVDIFKELGLIEILDNGAIFMTEIQNFIGNSSTEADRKRLYRNKIEREKGQISDKCPDKNPPELEKDIEIKKEKEKRDNMSSSIDEIIKYLNQKAKKNYKSTTPKTKTLIKARFKEGFTLNDFKIVIDKKVRNWINDSKMVAYLRPETLFGTKFESYLNEAEIVTEDFSEFF